MAEMLDYHYRGSQKDNLKRRLSSLLLRLGPKKTGGLLLTLLVMLALPITLIAVQQRQNLKQRASELQCVQNILASSGNAGVRPTGGLFQPSVAIQGNRMYIFVVGEGGEETGKPIEDWYNLFVRHGIINGDGTVSWEGFINMGGILSSDPKTFVDGRGIHIYVNGFDVNTRTPSGSYMTIIEPNNTIIPWTGVDGNEGNASQNTQIAYNGREYRFTTEDGPLSGCFLGSPPVVSTRANVGDRPDEVSGNQFKAIYVIPSDGEDRELDLNGGIETSIKAIQKKLLTNSQGYQLRFDTYDGGKLDVGFVKMTLTKDQAKHDPSHGILRSELQQAGYDINGQKKYAVYYDGETTYSCGSGGGATAVIITEGRDGRCKKEFARDENDFSLNEGRMLHELFHAMGAITSNTAHSPNGGHITNPDASESEYDQTRDLLYGGTRTWRIEDPVIDINHDDYFKVADAAINDVSDSPFLVRGTGGESCNLQFWDMCNYSEETKKAITCLSNQFGVVRGYNDGRFGGNDTILRGTYVAFLVRYRRDVLKEQDWIDDFNNIGAYYDNLPDANSGAPFGQKKFSDIDKSNPLWKEIYLSQKKGFILGYTDGEFKPYEKWFFGFHGITRDDNFRGQGYNFSSPPQEDQWGINRKDFITKLYQYSQDRYADKISSCSQ